MNSNPAEGPSAASACVMVIFGATGDLTKRKLIPALLNLAQEGVLNKQFAIIGVAGNDSTTESFRKTLTMEIPKFAPDPIDLKMWDWLVERIYYVRGDFGDPDTYKRLQAQMVEVDKATNCGGNKFYYLAVAPRFFASIVEQLGAAGMTAEENGKWARVIVEKPFGHDLQSAVQLNSDLKKVLTEKQIYRIDHYLGKRPCRTSWSSVFRTTSSSLSGTATTSTTCRLPPPKLSAWNIAAAFMKPLALCATWCPITSSNCSP